MEVKSAFNAGVEGFKRAKETADQAASDIASNNIIHAEQHHSATAEVNAEVQTDITNSAKEQPELNQAIVNLKVAEFQAKASAHVIQSADDSLGTLLDVTV
ncbi:MAG: hypothetical protein GY919_06005 [Photobacterium aquimaris]|nr:hypothetical protein [Photobacterium aquimaris]